MVEMACEEHDRIAAGSQFITHTIGRVLGAMEPKPSAIDTRGYEVRARHACAVALRCVSVQGLVVGGLPLCTRLGACRAPCSPGPAPLPCAITTRRRKNFCDPVATLELHVIIAMRTCAIFKHIVKLYYRTAI